MVLTLSQCVELPPHSHSGRGEVGEFDHADVHKSSGRVFVSHTTTGNIEVIDGKRAIHIKTISGCPEASGVLCAQEQNLVFAAARGAGKVLVINPNTCTVWWRRKITNKDRVLLKANRGGLIRN